VAPHVEIPVDNPSGRNTMESVANLALTIDKPTTSALRQIAGENREISLNDAVITAIMKALSAWTGKQQVGLTVNGHGRDLLHEDYSVNVSRTVGFFTNVHPVYATIPVGQSFVDTARHIQGHMANMPHKGNSFGMLQYLSEDESVRMAFDRYTYPEVLFNFFGGQFDAVGGDTAGAWNVNKNFSLELPEDHEVFYKLVIVGYLEDSCLKLNFRYSEEQYRSETIEGLMKLFEAQIAAVIKGYQHI
jgi:non-ribosomal peptide synthase protein (TIGR01720 family)